MKTYFRLLAFAKPIEKFAIPYLIFTLLGVIFNTLNLALLAPLLSTLFNTNGREEVVKPESWTDVFGYLNFYANEVKMEYGALGALQMVCAVIIASVILGNLFR